MSDIEEALSRLESGYYNSDGVTEENPGGMGNGGHVQNLPALLKDTGDVVRVSTNAVEGSQAGQSASEAARDEAQAWATSTGVVSGGLKGSRGYALDTAADAEQTGLDRVATGEDRVATGEDRTEAQNARDLSQQWATSTGVVAGGLKGARGYAQDTAADAEQTGLDRVATGEDRVATGEDKTASQDARAGAEAALQSAVVFTGNTHFAAGLDGWSPSIGTWSWEETHQGRVNVALTSAGGKSRLISQRRFEVDTARKYRLHYAYHVGPGSGSAEQWLSIICRDAAGDPIGVNSGYQHVGGRPVVPAGTGWVQDVGPVFTGEEIIASGFSQPVFRQGTRSVSLAFSGNFNEADLAVALDYFWLEDVTATEKAAADAQAAQTAREGAETALGTLADEVDQAQAARNKAEEWADKGEDQPVEEGPDRFSAKHWAMKGAALVTALPYVNLNGLSGTPADRFLKTGADQSLIARTAAEFRGDIGANSASNLDEGTLEEDRLAAAVYRRANILGAVGLSGGVPDGAIIQEGSGPMGWWVRLTNGLQICFVEFDDTANGWTTADGDLFRGSSLTTWTFPVQFAATPAIASFAWRNSTSIHGASYRSASSLQCLLIPWSAQSVAASVTKTLSALAIGRF